MDTKSGMVVTSGLEEEYGYLVFNGDKISVWEDSSGDGWWRLHNNVNVLMSLNSTLKNDLHGKFCYACVNTTNRRLK